jgi:hypothetical protein
VDFERDASGRIVTVADRRGNRLEVGFTTGAVPTELPEAPGLTAHVFGSVEETRYEAIGPEVAWEEVDTLVLPGWTFLGGVTDGDSGVGGSDAGPAPETVGGQSQSFPGAAERVRSLRDFETELQALIDAAPDLGSEVRPGTAKNRDFMDLVHLDHAFRAAAEMRGFDDDAEETASLDLITKAWLHLLVREERTLPSHPSGAGWRLGSGWPPLSGWRSGPAPLGLGTSLALPPASPLPWGNRLATGLFSQEQGICDDIPPDEGGGQEHDPTGGTATPGRNGSQRLLPSGAGSGDENEDCGKVGDMLEGLETVRDAFQNTQPRQGETGPEYAKRIEVDFFGLGEPGGAHSPAQTDVGSCVILGNRAYYDSQPPVVRASDCAHERHHQDRCRWARDNAAGGFEGWAMNPWNYRQEELDAYDAGIQVLEDWMAANGCSRQ